MANKKVDFKRQLSNLSTLGPEPGVHLHAFFRKHMEKAFNAGYRQRDDMTEDGSPYNNQSEVDFKTFFKNNYGK